MYKTVITFKKDTPVDILASLRETAEKYFDNRLGKVANTSDDPFECVFEGEERFHNCLQIAIVKLGDSGNFRDYVESWEWYDSESPRENHSVLVAFEEIAVMRAKAKAREAARARRSSGTRANYYGYN